MNPEHPAHGEVKVSQAARETASEIATVLYRAMFEEAGYSASNIDAAIDMLSEKILSGSQDAQPLQQILARFEQSLTTPPATDVALREALKAELADLITRYYRHQIGQTMKQAQHWMENGKPLAVHHRVMSADEMFQTVVLFDPERRKLGFDCPFKIMEDWLKLAENWEQGKYPPSAELHKYRDPRFVTEALNGPAPTPPDQPQIGDALLNPLYADMLTRPEVYGDFHAPQIGDEEKVARALYENGPHQTPWDDLGESDKLSWLSDARAAIAAMPKGDISEPTRQWLSDRIETLGHSYARGEYSPSGHAEYHSLTEIAAALRDRRAK